MPGAKSDHFKPREYTIEIVKRLEAWRRDPSAITAAELIETAIVLGLESEAKNAAQFLLCRDSGATPLVRFQAEIVLGEGGQRQEASLVTQRLGGKPWRRLLREYPANPLAWVELAREQVISGQMKRADRSMNVALKLAPNDRHVLRSAACFHLSDPEKAHAIVARSDAVKYDPWIMSAEIALADSAEIAPLQFKKGLALLDLDQHLPRQVSELASAVATKFLLDGNRKRGKSHFRQSLIDPTGNSLAQAEWAGNVLGAGLSIEPQLKYKTDATEALALHAYNSGQFNDCLRLSKVWIGEEPFSLRGYEAASSVANVLEEYECAESSACKGLRFHPNSSRLVNSRIFSLASLGHLDRAEELIAGLTSNLEMDSKLVLEANRGLIALRRGNVAEGRSLYQAAVDGFQRMGNTRMARLAEAYLIREAVLAKLPEARKLLDAALKKPEGPYMKDVTFVLRSIKQRLAGC
jgi:tetratricopeptide (TPR) repeat protein